MRLGSLTLHSITRQHGATYAAQSLGTIKGVNPVLTTAKPNRRRGDVDGDCLVQTSR
jgi:hypothetical protein